VATPYLSEIKLFPFNFAPRNWALCAGQLLPINQNQALFALLGTTYGGNGVTTFALPDLRGRAPAGFGQGPGLASYVLGERSGAEAVALAIAEMPAHTHTVNLSNLSATLPCRNETANQRGPAGAVQALEATDATATYSSAFPDAVEGSSAIVPAIAVSNVGAGTEHNNMQPYLVLNYCIALIGIFPSQA